MMIENTFSNNEATISPADLKADVGGRASVQNALKKWVLK